MPNVSFPFDTLGNSAGPNGANPAVPQTPVVLSPEQHAVLQVLAQHIASNMPLTPSPSPGGRGVPRSTPAPPRYQVVKHPSAPKRLPYAIKDHATGGYVTGNSPHFPRVFSTAAEAHDNIPSQETLPANLSDSAISSYGLQNGQQDDLVHNPLGFAPSNSLLTQAEQTHAGSAHLSPIPPHPSAISPHPLVVNAVQTRQPAVGAGPRVEVRVNRDAPARLPYGQWDNQAQDWARDRFGFAQAYGTQAEAHENLPAEATPAAMLAGAWNAGSNAMPPPSSDLQLASYQRHGSSVPAQGGQGTAAASNPAHLSAATAGSGKLTAGLSTTAVEALPPGHTVPGPMRQGPVQPPQFYQHQLDNYMMSTGRHPKIYDPLFKMSQAQMGQYRTYRTQTDEANLADTTEKLNIVLARKDANGHLSPEDHKKYQYYLAQQKMYQHMAAFDQFIGTSPGPYPGDPGRQPENCAIGVQQFSWVLGRPWTKIPHVETAGGMRALMAQSKDWQEVSTPQPGDIIFIPTNMSNSGYHVVICADPTKKDSGVAFEADNGVGKPHSYMRLAKYGTYELGRHVEIFRYTGQLEQRKPGDSYPWTTINDAWNTDAAKPKPGHPAHHGRHVNGPHPAQDGRHVNGPHPVHHTGIEG